MIIILLVLVLTLWLIWRWKVITTFQRLGIPGPKPNILFGNLLEILMKGQIKCHEEWTKKYGRVLGYYFGMTPAILVSDSNLLKTIMIKDFSKFIARESHFLLLDGDTQSPTVHGLSGCTPENWKRIRSILAPTFTTSKLKQMFGSIHLHLNFFMKKMQKLAESDQEFDSYDAYRETILNIFAGTACGLKIDEQTNDKSKLFSHLAIAELKPVNDPLVIVARVFPSLRRLCVHIFKLYNYCLHGGTARSYIGPKILDIIRTRRQKPQGKHFDLLQLMSDAYSSRPLHEINDAELEAGSTESEVKENFEKKQQSKTMQYLTAEEIMQNSYGLFFAAFGTSSRFLAYATYFLAKHQDVQEKLYEEIEAYYQKEKTFEDFSITKLPYLNKIFCEVLRLRPPVHFFSNRRASEDVMHGDMKIPKGMLVQTPIYVIHYDPEYWHNPEKFDPDRFDQQPNSNEITYLPFGVGPRNCIGKRFAEMEVKILLALIFYHYRVHLSRHKDNLPTVENTRSLAPSEGVWIKLEKRNQYQPLHDESSIAYKITI